VDGSTHEVERCAGLQAASPVPVIGAVEPGAESALAASERRRIGVIGTLATVASGAYGRAIAALAPDARVTTLACPLLVPLAEEGWTDDDIARAVAHRYLARLFEQDPGIDTLVLGCTHYPLLAAVLGHTARDLAGRVIAVVDSATAMATAARARLGQDPRPHGQGGLHCFATDTSRLEELAPRFLGEPLASFSLVDL
jgi:glutamate racemase